MKKIAVIGFGNHVKKNIIPAFKRSEKMDIDSIYVRDPNKYRQKSEEYGVRLKAIADDIDGAVEWVYISTPISTHFELASKYLNLGKNVICEKPLTDSPEKTKKLLELAIEKGLQLHEVCMYQYHKQFEHLKKTISGSLKSLKSVSARFTIPHLANDDIRYKKELAGGALLDVGYYPVSLFFSLFGKPKSIKATRFTEDRYEVDLVGSAIFEYEKFYCIGEWGIGLPYSNEATVITEKQIIKYERIFSKPETHSTIAKIKEGFDSCDVEIGEDDHFVNMFRSIIFARSSKYIKYSESIHGLSIALNDLSQGLDN